MNEDQAKVLLKKSALQTTEDFTDSLMVQIDAKSINHIQPGFPSVKRVLSIITLVVVLASALLFCVDFKFLSEIRIIGNASHTKFFVVLLFSTLLGMNHILRLRHSSKYLIND